MRLSVLASSVVGCLLLAHPIPRAEACDDDDAEVGDVDIEDDAPAIPPELETTFDQVRDRLEQVQRTLEAVQRRLEHRFEDRGWHRELPPIPPAPPSAPRGHLDLPNSGFDLDFDFDFDVV